MSFPKYGQYKESGVRWLGSVPDRWSVKALKHVFTVVGGSTPKSEVGDYWDGEHVWVTPADLSSLPGFDITESSRRITTAGLASCGTNLVPAGSIVLSTRAPIGSLAIAGTNLCTNQGCKSLVTKGRAHPRFYAYLLSIVGEELNVRGRGTTFLELSADALGAFEIVEPTPEDQGAIVDFLDRETAKIDVLVEEQRRLIELLKEKRQAVISHAVTKGLDAGVPLKDSGVEWLGAVPEHWNLLATKRLFRVVADPAPDDNEYELLSIYTAIGVRPRQDLEQRGNRATTQDGYWMVRKGDLIVNKLLAWMGAIGVSDYDGVTSPAYDILRATVPLEPRFYDYLFRCGICFTEFRRYSRGIMDMRLRLYFDELGQLVMPFPPLDEQRRIVSHLQSEAGKFDALSDEAFRAIELLRGKRLAAAS